MGSGPGKCQKMFGEGPCGNVPGPKTRFSIKKEGACGNVPTPKNLFFMKIGACGNVPRQNTHFCRKKKTPAATHQDQTRIFSQKSARGSVPGPRINFLRTVGCQIAFLKHINPLLANSHMASLWFQCPAAVSDFGTAAAFRA